MQKIEEFFKNNWADALLLTFFIIIAYILTNSLVLLHINGQSMFPSYADGDVVLMRKEKELVHDNILVFNSPESWSQTSESKRFIKRLIATEGDTITYTDNYLTVNGENPIFMDRMFCEEIDREKTLTENQFFVIGDNTYNSNDSLTQMCLNNEEFYIEEESILTSGYELFTMTKFGSDNFE